MTRPLHAELVALGIQQHDPTDHLIRALLDDCGTGQAEVFDVGEDLGPVMIGCTGIHIEMDPVLGLLGFGDLLEEQPRTHAVRVDQGRNLSVSSAGRPSEPHPPTEVDHRNFGVFQARRPAKPGPIPMINSDCEVAHVIGNLQWLVGTEGEPA